MNRTKPNTVMELTATFAACAALPRTCFRMSAVHHHVGQHFPFRKVPTLVTSPSLILYNTPSIKKKSLQCSPEKLS